jgi:hypothetical protein
MKKKNIVKIDFDKMNQYQFWKYIERLKDFERKEVVFHESYKNDIQKFNRTLEFHHPKKNKSRINNVVDTKRSNSVKNSDLRIQKLQKSEKVIRIRKSKVGARVLSAQKRNPKSNNSEMLTTMSSLMIKNKKKKRKKLPSLKLSFELENSINPMSTISTRFHSNEGSRSKYNVDPIFENKSHARMISINSESSFNAKFSKTRTSQHFYKSKNQQMRPASGYMQKPPIARLPNKNRL